MVTISGKQFSESEFAQAQKLIFRGNVGAARGDPRLTQLIRLLQAGGQRTAEQIQAPRPGSVSLEVFEELKLRAEETQILPSGIRAPTPSAQEAKRTLREIGSVRAFGEPQPLFIGGLGGVTEEEFEQLEEAETPGERRDIALQIREERERPSFFDILSRPVQGLDPREFRAREGTFIREEIEPFIKKIKKRETIESAVDVLFERGVSPIGDLIIGGTGLRNIPGFSQRIDPIIERATERAKGIVSEPILFPIEQPEKTIVLLGVGGALGFALKGLGLGATALGLESQFSQATLIGGTILTAKIVTDIGEQVISEKDLREQGRIIGRTATEFSLLGGGVVAGEKGFIKTAGFLRTIGRTEILAKDIIAPEIFQGQTFPKIRRGQTAGELRSEFFKFQLPGEQPGFPRGFTASPQQFGKLTEIKFGTSELPGLFQAPKVSPRFLRIGGERFKLVGLDKFGTGFPTIIRLQPESLSLVPGLRGGERIVSGGFRGGRPITPRAKEIFSFFEKAPKGQAFIPFIKTEKEAVVAFGTPIEKIGGKFFTRFQGVRIPIEQFKVVPGAKDITSQLGIQNLGDVVGSASSRRLAITPIFTPSKIGAFSSLVSRPSKLSSRLSLSSLGRSSSLSLPSSSSLRSSLRDIGSFAKSFSSSLPKLSDFGSSLASFRRGGGRAPPLIPPPPIIPDFPTMERIFPGRRRTAEAKKKRRRLPKRKPFVPPIRPSFSAIVLNLEGILPTGREFFQGRAGVIPGAQFRFVPKRRKSKKRITKKRITKRPKRRVQRNFMRRLTNI